MEAGIKRPAILHDQPFQQRPERGHPGHGIGLLSVKHTRGIRPMAVMPNRAPIIARIHYFVQQQNDARTA
jgi:hypothetical protein